MGKSGGRQQSGSAKALAEMHEQLFEVGEELALVDALRWWWGGDLVRLAHATASHD